MIKTKNFSKTFSLVFIQNKNKEILLGYKKRGFGQGKWNGFGGKIEKNETIINSAIRETKEESNLNINSEDLKLLGIIQFDMKNLQELLLVFIFKTYSFKGEIKESEEMKPQWFEISKLNFKEMWADDEFWFKYMLKDQCFIGTVDFEDYEKIINCELEQCSNEKLFETYKNLTDIPLK